MIYSRTVRCESCGQYANIVYGVIKACRSYNQLGETPNLLYVYKPFYIIYFMPSRGAYWKKGGLNNETVTLVDLELPLQTSIGATIGATVELGELNFPSDSIFHVNSGGIAEAISDVSLGNVFISQGLTTTPIWGKITNIHFTSGDFNAITGIGIQTQDLDMGGFDILLGAGGFKTTGIATGNLFKANGGKYDDFALGTSNQVLHVNAGGTDLEYGTLDDNSLTSGIFSNITGLGNQTQDLNMGDNDIALGAGTIFTTGSATGHLLKHNGTSFDDFIRGTANQVLHVNSGGTDLEYGTLDNNSLASGVFSNITGLGTQSQILNMGTNKITNVVDPTSIQDVATKKYVDDQIITFDTFAELGDTTITTPADAQIPIFDSLVGGGDWVNQSISGDITIAKTGVSTIGALKVTNDMLTGSINNSKLLTNPLARASHTGTDPISGGGTGQITQQTAIDALTNVSGATDEHVLTKDTASGNAIFKVAGGGGTVKQIFSTKLIFTSTSTPRTSSIFGEVVIATDAGAQTILNSAITAVDNTIFLGTNSKTSTITFALNDDGVDVLQVSTTSGQTGEFSASGSVVVAVGSLVNFTVDGGTSSGQLDFSMTLEYTR